jgi:hypothetical protein
MPTQTHAPLLEAMMNLTRFHREHEKFYASSPREFAVTLQRHARTLQALADQWSVAEASHRAVLSPYEGAEDLNSAVAVQLDGVLFLEGEGRPPEMSHLIRDLRNAAEEQKATGEWLATAMESSWAVAATLIEIDGLADLLGERHRIIANDWQAAAMNTVMSHLLDRAADILEHVDFTPAALRADLDGEQVSVGLVYSAAELISHAADLCSDSAGLVHANERRWRVFRHRVAEVLASQPPAGPRDDRPPLEGSSAGVAD